MSGIYDQSSVPSFDSHPCKNPTRGHSLKIQRPISKTNLGQNLFTSCIVNDWNSLPEGVINAETVIAFKNSLYEFFLAMMPLFTMTCKCIKMTWS